MATPNETTLQDTVSTLQNKVSGFREQERLLLQQANQIRSTETDPRLKRGGLKSIDSQLNIITARRKIAVENLKANREALQRVQMGREADPAQIKREARRARQPRLSDQAYRSRDITPTKTDPNKRLEGVRTQSRLNSEVIRLQGSPRAQERDALSRQESQIATIMVNVQSAAPKNNSESPSTSRFSGFIPGGRGGVVLERGDGSLSFATNRKSRAGLSVQETANQLQQEPFRDVLRRVSGPGGVRGDMMRSFPKKAGRKVEGALDNFFRDDSITIPALTSKGSEKTYSTDFLEKTGKSVTEGFFGVGLFAIELGGGIKKKGVEVLGSPLISGGNLVKTGVGVGGEILTGVATPETRRGVQTRIKSSIEADKRRFGGGATGEFASLAKVGTEIAVFEGGLRILGGTGKGVKKGYNLLKSEPIELGTIKIKIGKGEGTSVKNLKSSTAQKEVTAETFKFDVKKDLKPFEGESVSFLDDSSGTLQVQEVKLDRRQLTFKVDQPIKTTKKGGTDVTDVLGLELEIDGESFLVLRKGKTKVSSDLESLPGRKRTNFGTDDRPQSLIDDIKSEKSFNERVRKAVAIDNRDKTFRELFKKDRPLKSDSSSFEEAFKDLFKGKKGSLKTGSSQETIKVKRPRSTRASKNKPFDLTRKVGKEIAPSSPSLKNLNKSFDNLNSLGSLGGLGVGVGVGLGIKAKSKSIQLFDTSTRRLSSQDFDRSLQGFNVKQSSSQDFSFAQDTLTGQKARQKTNLAFAFGGAALAALTFKNLKFGDPLPKDDFTPGRPRPVGGSGNIPFSFSFPGFTRRKRLRSRDAPSFTVVAGLVKGTTLKRGAAVTGFELRGLPTRRVKRKKKIVRKKAKKKKRR